jgi:hypothetical protein
VAASVVAVPVRAVVVLLRGHPDAAVLTIRM